MFETQIKLTEDIWFYKNVHPNISELLKNIQGQNNWWDYTNGLNPDGTECHSGIRGSATNLWPDTDNYSEVINIFKNVFEDYVEKNRERLSLNITSPVEDNIDVKQMPERTWIEQKNILVRKYTAGSFMLPHDDGGVGIVPSFTALLWFNEDFEGGELEFPDLNLILKPEAGSVLVFPSILQHGVKTLISGERFVTSAYIYETPGV
jgi:prolyl 4-hydroxylase